MSNEEKKLLIFAVDVNVDSDTLEKRFKPRIFEYLNKIDLNKTSIGILRFGGDNPSFSNEYPINEISLIVNQIQNISISYRLENVQYSSVLEKINKYFQNNNWYTSKRVVFFTNGFIDLQECDTYILKQFQNEDVRTYCISDDSSKRNMSVLSNLANVKDICHVLDDSKTTNNSNDGLDIYMKQVTTMFENIQNNLDAMFENIQSNLDTITETLNGLQQTNDTFNDRLSKLEGMINSIHDNIGNPPQEQEQKEVSNKVADEVPVKMSNDKEKPSGYEMLQKIINATESQEIEYLVFDNKRQCLRHRVYYQTIEDCHYKGINKNGYLYFIPTKKGRINSKYPGLAEYFELDKASTVFNVSDIIEPCIIDNNNGGSKKLKGKFKKAINNSIPGDMSIDELVHWQCDNVWINNSFNPMVNKIFRAEQDVSYYVFETDNTLRKMKVSETIAECHYKGLHLDGCIYIIPINIKQCDVTVFDKSHPGLNKVFCFNGEEFRLDEIVQPCIVNESDYSVKLGTYKSK